LLQALSRQISAVDVQQMLVGLMGIAADDPSKDAEVGMADLTSAGATPAERAAVAARQHHICGVCKRDLPDVFLRKPGAFTGLPSVAVTSR
jgi:hypothetical protein